jgi:hypothetical protein
MADSTSHIPEDIENEVNQGDVYPKQVEKKTGKKVAY